MGYELHLTRAKEWYESDEAPIPLAEWLSYAATNPSLVERGCMSSDDTRVPLYAYVCHDGVEVSLTWHGGRISVKGVRDNAGALELVTVADDLRARLISDDGEHIRRSALHRLATLVRRTTTRSA